MQNLRLKHQQPGRRWKLSVYSPTILSKDTTSILLAALMIVTVCGPLLNLTAADFVVSNTLDSGPGSLRYAISNATVSAGADTITCTNVSGTIILGSPLPALPDRTTILGPGSGSLVVSGSNSFRVFQVDSGASVSISGITIANGYVTNQGGAGIFNSGILTLSNAAVVQNLSLSTPGGGIYNQGTLRLVSSTIASNVAGIFQYYFDGLDVRGFGGGVYIESGSVSVSNSTLSANKAFGGSTYEFVFPFSGEAAGGGIYVQGGRLIMSGSTLSGNLARGGPGGNVDLVSGTSGADAYGGAIFFATNSTSDHLLINCTVSGNRSEGGPGGGAWKYGGSGGDGFGGGVYLGSWSSNCHFVNCTLYQNAAAGGVGGSGGIEPPYGPGSPGYGYGHGVYARETGPTFLNSIVQASTGTIISRGFNIFERGSSIGGAIPSDITNIVITLDPLADNGGPTLTHALLPGSPAVDAGTSAGAPGFDQRGVPRLKGASVDIGAFESSFQGSSAFITGQPQDLSLLTGATAVFSVAARGTKPHYFQWQFNGTDIARATNSSLAITNLQLAEIGHYSVTVSNAFGSETSRAAKLDVTPDTPLNNWSVRQDLKTYRLEAISYGNGLFVAVGYEYVPTFNRGIILTSPDGATWSETFSQSGPAFRDVTFGNGSFVAVSSAQSEIAISTNGADWTLRSVPSAQSLYVVGFGAGKFIAAGGYYGGAYFAGNVLTSTDTVNWTLHNLGYTPWYSGFAFGNGAYLLVGGPLQFSVDRILRSSDGVSWITSNPPTPDHSWRSVEDALFADNQFIALEYVSSSPYATEILTSDDGMNWVGQAHLTDNLNALASGYGIHVAVGRNGAVWSSTNITQWTPHFRNTSGELTDVVAGQGTFVAVGYNGIILQSGALQSFDLTVSVHGQGTVNRSPDKPQYKGGESVSLEAIPARSQSFIQWSDGVTSNPRVVIVSESNTYTAVFTPVPTLDILPSGGGRVSAVPSNSFYLNNAVVGLNATPEPGWRFAQWLGDVSGTNTNTAVIVNRDRCVQAVFGTSIITNVIGSGGIRRSPATELYPYGARITLMPVPNRTSYFAQWGDDPSATNNPFTLTLTNANPTVTAIFAALPPNQYSLTALPEGFGQVNTSPMANRYGAGTTITLSAVPDAGQTFVGWSGDASGTQNPLLVTMDSSKVITAQFTKRPTLTVQSCAEPSVADGFSFLISGEFGARFVIEKSQDGQSWLPLATITNRFGVTQFNDTSATNAELRMYRAAPVAP